MKVTPFNNDLWVPVRTGILRNDKRDQFEGNMHPGKWLVVQIRHVIFEKNRPSTIRNNFFKASQTIRPQTYTRYLC